MKTLLAGCVAFLASLILLPSVASADQLVFIGRCGNCGVPMYGQTVVSGYDRYGYPVYRTVPVTHYCQARRYGSHDQGHHHSHSPYGYGRGDGYRGYDYDRDRGRSCDRPRVGFSFSIIR